MTDTASIQLNQLLVLTLDDRPYALRLESVERVVRAVEVAPLPGAPEFVLGIINMEGRIIPAIDLRKRFLLPEKELYPTDRFIISTTPKRTFALTADTVHDVIGCPAEAFVPATDIFPHNGPVEGVLILGDGMVLIYDIEKFLSPQEETVLDDLLRGLDSDTAIAPPGKSDQDGMGPEAGEGAEIAMKNGYSAPVAAVRRTNADAADEWAPSPERRRDILKARAQALARRPDEEETGTGRIEIVEFLLAHERYGIESSCISEVHALREFTPLPCTPPFVLGIINVRGKVLSVIDLRKFFDLPQRGLTDLTKVVIVHDGTMEFGVLADAVLGSRQVPTRDLQRSLPTLTDVRAAYLMGVTDERLIVLDGRKILSDGKIVVHEEV